MFLRPRKPGGGLKAHRTVMAIAQLAGIKDLGADVSVVNSCSDGDKSDLSLLLGDWFEESPERCSSCLSGELSLTTACSPVIKSPLGSPRVWDVKSRL